jgi:hypothetical protein
MFGAVDARLELNPSWRAGQIDRLRDERHSGVVAALVTMLEALGWMTAVEVTYQHYGDRGSVDVLAVHPTLGLALIIEVKTEITSQESLMRRLDEKTRLGAQIVLDRFGWRPTSVSRLLVLEATMTNRRRVTALAPILDRAFPLRSDPLRAWLRRPAGAISGLLFVSASHPRTQRNGDADHLASVSHTKTV